MSKILDRTGTGAALTAAQNDSNLSSLSGINEAVTGTTYTVTIDDQNRTLEFSNVASIAVTMTDIATIAAALHTDDFKVTLINIGAGTVTATCGSTDTFLGGGTTLVLLQGEYATIQTDSTLAIWNIIDSGKNLLGLTSSVAQLNFNSQIKAFGKFTAAGVVTSSYNVSSITVIGTGRFRVNFTNAMSTTTFCALTSVATNPASTGGLFACLDSANTATTSIDIHVFDTAGVLTDPSGGPNGVSFYILE